MITDIETAQAPHGWSLSRDFEHEVRLSGGRVADLKNLYGVDFVRLGTSTVELAMSDESCANPVVLLWSELSYLNVETLGPIRPANDGRVGIIGVRLMGDDNDDIEFEIELDWLRISLRARAFHVVGPV